MKAMTGAAALSLSKRSRTRLAPTPMNNIHNREVVINLTINALGALVLIAGLWPVRQQLRADRRERREDEQR